MKMQREANSRTLILVLFLAMLICSGSIHSCDFASSPSPSPALGMPRPPEPSKGIFRKKRRGSGSFPAICYSKCNQCEPCMPVQVSVRAMELEENEYYPQVWKCACGDNIFSP